MLAADSPAKLDKHIDILFSSLVRIFNRNGFSINWSKGKTEAMLKYRGNGASAAMRRRCSGGTPVISLPSFASAANLCVVASYKHLGSVVSADGSLGADAMHRESLALNAFAPIAVCVFGSRLVLVSTKLISVPN